jgi:hypothetical protein
VKIRVTPKTARVLVDGVEVPNGEEVTIGARMWTVVISLKGYDDVHETLEPGRTKPLDVVMKKKGAAKRKPPPKPALKAKDKALTKDLSTMDELKVGP